VGIQYGSRVEQFKEPAEPAGGRVGRVILERKIPYVRLEVFTAVTMKNAVF
jgi:hypothetical protein